MQKKKGEKRLFHLCGQLPELRETFDMFTHAHSEQQAKRNIARRLASLHAGRWTIIEYRLVEDRTSIAERNTPNKVALAVKAAAKPVQLALFQLLGRPFAH